MFYLLVFVFILNVVVSDIIPYQNDIIYPQHPAYLSVPKFAPKDAPDWSPGNGNSFIGDSFTLHNCWMFILWLNFIFLSIYFSLYLIYFNIKYDNNRTYYPP